MCYRHRWIVALAPAGGWAEGDESYKDTARLFKTMQEQAKLAAPNARELLSTPAGRRGATRYIVENAEHIPVELLAHILLSVVGCTGAPAMIEYAIRAGYEQLDAQRITCPVRVVWGTEDKLLPWPSAAARLREDWLPHADWVGLDGVGHCPQLDVPLVTAQLILGLTARLNAPPLRRTSGSAARRGTACTTPPR